MGPSGKPVTEVGYQFNGMSAKTSHKEEAWRFNKFMCAEKDGVELHTKGAVMACLKAADPRQVYPIKDHMDDLMVEVNGQQFGEELWDAPGVSTQMGTVSTEEYGKLVLDKQDGKTTVANIQKRINELFASQ